MTIKSGNKEARDNEHVAVNAEILLKWSQVPKYRARIERGSIWTVGYRNPDTMNSYTTIKNLSGASPLRREETPLASVKETPLSVVDRNFTKREKN